MWPGKGPLSWGHTQFRVTDDPEICQLGAEYDPDLYQSDQIIKVFRNLTKFAFDPEWSVTQMDPFPGHVDPGA